jgi:hypothetical protein
VNPFRGVFIMFFALLSATCLGLFSGSVCAQDRVQGEFKLSHPARWGQVVLPEGRYIYLVEMNSSRPVVRVWKMGGGFSDSFVPQSLVRGNHLLESGIILQRTADGSYVASIFVPQLNAELEFSDPEANSVSTVPKENSSPELPIPGAGSSQYFTFINPRHENVTLAEAEKVYLNACEVVQREFNRTDEIRPRLILRLGARENLLHYPDREVQLKKWDEFRFAEAVVDLALHDLVPVGERIKLGKLAVTQSDMTVSLCELKPCMN